MCITDIQAYLQTSDLRNLHRVLDDHGMRWVEIEFLSDWWLRDGVADRESDAVRRACLSAAEQLGAAHIKVGGDMTQTATPPATSWAEDLFHLCEQASDAGTCIAIEFLPFSNVPDLPAARELAEASGHPRAKIMIDSWHVARSSTSLAEIAELPAELIAGVELDDGSLLPQDDDPYADTVNNRRLPGSGEFDLEGLIMAVVGTGWTGPWGVEIISSDHRARPLQESLAEVFAATNALVDAVAGSAP